MRRLPPKAFQFVTFTCNDNKDVEMCVLVIKKCEIKWFNTLDFVNNLIKYINKQSVAMNGFCVC